MSVYVSDAEMDLLHEFYDFYTTQMEGASLDDKGQAEYDAKSEIFWNFYNKCRQAKENRELKKKFKRLLSKCQKRDKQ